MKILKTSLVLLSILALSVAAVASGALTSKQTSGHASMSGMHMTTSHSA